MLSYQQGADSFGNATYSGLQLRIARAGTTVYARAGRIPPTARGRASPKASRDRPTSAPLQVVDLEGTGEPTVVLHLYTGGEHCCQVLQIFSYDAATGSYQLAERDFGDAADLVADVAGDRRLEIESADDRFAYRFTSYAFSGLPLQIWRFQGGRLVDATRAFPAALAADAARQWAAFLANRRKGLGLGFIAAWTADETLLGRRTAAERRLRTEARLHRLRSARPAEPDRHRVHPQAEPLPAAQRLRLRRRRGDRGRPSSGRYSVSGRCDRAAATRLHRARPLSGGTSACR